MSAPLASGALLFPRAPGIVKSPAALCRHARLDRTKAGTMSRWPFVLTTLLVLAGCRTQPYVNAHIETVNAEFRELEDYTYYLEEEKARLQQELAAIRRGQIAPGAGRDGGAGGIFRRRPAGAGDGSDDLNPPRIEASPAPTDDAPVIEMPGSEPAPLPPPGAGASALRPAGEQPASAIEPADTKITHLHLHPLLTGGADFDGQSGDDGLSVVLEPRNADDEYVPQAGPVSIIVLDPARQGDAARVARWDFDLSAARQALAAAPPARGLKFELQWPAAPPASTRLSLFVRYETPDGRKLQTSREIHLKPPGESSPGWTPRPGGPAVAAEASALPPPTVDPVPPAELSSNFPATQPPAWSPNR